MFSVSLLFALTLEQSGWRYFLITTTTTAESSTLFSAQVDKNANDAAVSTAGPRSW
jgi:hypothetical protein